MADTNGSRDWEKQHERIWEVLTGLIEHAEATDRRFEEVRQSFVELRQSQAETNAAVKSLTAAIRDLIDRIPPENLR